MRVHVTLLVHGTRTLVFLSALVGADLTRACPTSDKAFTLLTTLEKKKGDVSP